MKNQSFEPNSVVLSLDVYEGMKKQIEDLEKEVDGVNKIMEVIFDGCK